MYAFTQEIIAAIAALPLEQRSEWRELHETQSHAKLELDWLTLPRWTPEHREAVAVAIHDYALSHAVASEVLRVITRTDRRVGVWFACACARTVLRHVRAGENRPRLAIEAAERWVRGQATEAECQAATNAVRNITCDTYYGHSSADRSAYAAAAAGGNAAEAAYTTLPCASATNVISTIGDADAYAAADADPYANSWATTRDRSLRELLQSIACSTRDALDAAAVGYHAQYAGAGSPR